MLSIFCLHDVHILRHAIEDDATIDLHIYIYIFDVTILFFNFYKRDNMIIFPHSRTTNILNGISQIPSNSRLYAY